MFVEGQIYRRRELHREYGGQQQGGISTPASVPLIFAFTGEAGESHGYQDGWTVDGIFNYTGEGQIGDMELVRGNAALAGAVSSGRPVHLFSQVQKAFVRYVGEMRCTGFHEDRGPDRTGAMRRRFIFELTPVGALDDNDEKLRDHDESLETLRQRALDDAADSRDPVSRKVATRRRSIYIKFYARKRAGGNCEHCGGQAPFITPTGQPYLEVHHILRLSDGGPDHPRYVAAICPNCHRMAHLSNDIDGVRQALLSVIALKEDAVETAEAPKPPR